MEKKLSDFDFSALRENQQEIIDCIGLESYYKLSEWFGGSTIYVARANAIVSTQQRNEMIIEDFKNGATYRELAAKYNLSETWIRNIVAGRVKML